MRTTSLWQLLLCVGLIHAYTSRSFTNQQNTQTLLNSIDERLRNLDKSSTYRHASAVDQHMRKLEAIEGRIERFEAILSARFEKIEANMSVQYFKDDLAQDILLRKIDAVYERVHNKMFHIEMKIDAAERKITEKLDAIGKKFEHLEENSNRRGEVEEEVAEVFDVLDEMKSTLANVTQVMHVKFTQESKLPPKDLLGSLNNLESIVNATRYEQQNTMRNLVVMVGRLGGKTQLASTGADGELQLSQQLTNVSRKIDAHFDALMEQQTVFADSCHRIQSDEPQLEAKISEILEKIIDVFQKESAVEIKDIQNIEQLIKSHDTSVRRSLFTTSHNMAVLLQKSKEHKDNLTMQITNAEGNIIKMIKDLRSDLLMANESQVQVQLLDDLRALVSEFSRSQPIDKNNIKIIGEQLRNISGKIDDAMAVQLNARLDKDLDAAILQVFGNNNSSNTNISTNTNTQTNSSVDSADDGGNPIIFEEIKSVNCTSGLLDVRTNVNCTICPEISPGSDSIQTLQKQLENCTNDVITPAVPVSDDVNEQFVIDLRVDNAHNSTGNQTTLT